MNLKIFSDQILLGITGYQEKEIKNKLKEINKFKISQASLFLEWLKRKERKKIYQYLLDSQIKQLPLVHLKNDMTKEELIFLQKKFRTTYFTIHENSFKFLKNWPGFHQYLYLEMNTDNFVSQSTKVNKLGGFCIDLAHFKRQAEAWTKEFEYIIKRRKITRYFACNHLNGYDPKNNTDMHSVKSIKNFNYLKTLPKFLFGKVIALEMNNSIAEQIKYKKYLIKYLEKIF